MLLHFNRFFADSDNDSATKCDCYRIETARNSDSYGNNNNNDDDDCCGCGYNDNNSNNFVTEIISISW